MIEDSVQAPNLNPSVLEPEEQLSADDLVPVDLTPETSGEGSRFQRLLSATHRIGHMATRGSQTALVLLQVSPANEVVRFGAFGAGEAMTHSPVMGALTYGLSTLGVEVAGTLAGAPLLDTKPSEKITEFVNRKLSKARKSPDQKEYSKTTKLSTAFIGGTVAAMALEKLEDPSRTAEHNRRYGLWTSAWLAGACAVQGAAMSEGIDLASNNTKLAAGAASVAAVGATGGWLKRRLSKRNITEKEDSTKMAPETEKMPNTQEHPPRYDLDEQEYALLQDEFVKSIEAKTDKLDVYGAWLPSDHKYANLVRAAEAKIFPEIPEIMEPFEQSSVFLALVDTRPEARRIVHAFRLSWPGFAEDSSQEENADDPLKIVLLKDIIDSNQGLDAESVSNYYKSRGIELSQCMSVETNFRIGSKVSTESGAPVSQLGYISIFAGINRQGNINNKAAIFAHLNEPAVKSLGAVGIEYEPIAGKKGLKTPTVGDVEFDEKYEPVCIPASAHNMAIFTNLTPLAPRIIEV